MATTTAKWAVPKVSELNRKLNDIMNFNLALDLRAAANSELPRYCSILVIRDEK